jgi:hypothetical protein
MPASEGLEPRFGCFWFDVAEAVRKRRGSTLQLAKIRSMAFRFSWRHV